MSFLREVLPPKRPLVQRVVLEIVRSAPWRGIALVSTVSLLLWGLCQPRRMCCGGGSKVDIAKAIVKKYAFEAYPEWRAANPGRACPTTLAELNPWMGRNDVRDPWGGGYVIRCDANGFGVYSSGEDGIYGTADDIPSWQ